MAIKTRRNIANKHNRSGPPYNEIWESFYSILAPVFADRLPEGKRSMLYVPVPNVEKKIDEYIDSDSGHVAILHGLMGAGKSTILEHYAKSRNSNPKSYSIYLNFQGRRFHLIPDINHLNLTRADRRVAARTMVTKRLNELLLPFVDENLSYVNLNFFDFLRKYFLSEIGPKALFANGEEEKLKILKDFMSDPDKTAPIQCFIMYMAVTQKYEEFTVIVDNVDEQSFETVEGLFFGLADLLDCLMRPRRRTIAGESHVEQDKEAKDIFDHSIRFRAILACRSHTLEALRSDQEGILPTRGFEEIELKSGSLLTSIITRRLQAVKDDLRSQRDSTSRGRQDVPYTLKSGINVQIADALNFIEVFVSKLTSAAIESDLFDLFNHNHARALQNLKYVVQNRYFVSYDAEILSKGELRSDFHYVRVLKALSYGNPASAEHLYYPALSSVVPNVLYWDPEREETFLLVIRLLKWISKGPETSSYGNISSEGRKVSDCLNEYSEGMGASREAVMWALQYCHENGLIFSESGYRAPLSDGESVCISPRGVMALDHIFRDSMLFEILIDDIPAPKWRSGILDGRPPVVQHGTYPTKFHFFDTLSWLRMFLDGERRNLENVRKTPEKDPRKVLDIFDGKLVSELLARALKSSFNQFYLNVCTKRDKAEVNRLIDLCRDARAFYASGK
jgi:hypothetical protein